MKTTITWLFVGLLLISNVVLGLLLFTGDEASEGSEALATDVGSEIAGEEELFMSDDTVEEVLAAETVVEEETNTTYTAKAASFTLDIDEDYVVVVEKDGGVEAEQSTLLKIGRKNLENTGNIELHADDYVKVSAFPSNFNGTRDQFVTNDTALQGNVATEASSQIDGTQARKFTLNGVGKTIKYYFERGGETYLIEAWDVSSGDTQVMLNDVVDGFRFK